MPKQAQEGGATFLNTKHLLALAEDDAVVLAYRVRRMEDFPSSVPNATKSHVPQILAHLLVLSPEERAGELWMDQGLINGGITGPLTKEADDTAIGGRMETGKTGSNPWPALNPPKARDWKLIEKVYDAFGLDPEADDADEKLFAVLRDRAGEPGEKVDLSNKSGGGGGGGGGSGGNKRNGDTVLDRSQARQAEAKKIPPSPLADDKPADDKPPF